MSDRSHHLPLVVFTGLAIAGAGTIGADALLVLAGHAPDVGAAAFGTALLGAGLAASLTHLGRRERFALAARRAGRSPLSTEVVLGSLALAAGAASAAAGFGLLALPMAFWIAGGLAAAFLLSVGAVYRLGGQLTWRGPTVLVPLTAGLAFGVSLIEGLGRQPGVANAAMVVLLIDAAVFMLRWRSVTALAIAGRQGDDPWFGRRHELLLGRFLLLDALPFVLLVASPSALVPVVAAAGLVVDRFGFYALGIQHTTEREIAAVEATIERTSPPHQM